MIDLRSTAADRLLLDALGRRPVLALDFDGTLSPLVPDPAAAAMDPRMAPLLLPLMSRMPVAVVSGRGIADLAARIPLQGLILVGNHGNEWATAGGAQPAPQAAGEAAPARARNAQQRQVCLDWAVALAAPLAQLGPGIAFEAKSVSLSIHYRLVAEPARMRLKLLALVRALRPAPEIIEGKFVLNLMAPGLVSKYEAIEELVSRHQAGTVIFVGDDVTDERVFERAPADWLTVRVWDDEAGVAGANPAGASPSSGVAASMNESASASKSAARAFVQRVDGVVELLDRLGRLTRNL